MAKDSIASLSDKALLKEWDAAAKEALDARERARELGAEVERRQVAADAEAKVKAMTPGERAALAQAVEAVGIDSEEEVNG